MVLKKIFYFFTIFLISNSFANETIDPIKSSCYDIKKINYFNKPTFLEVKIYNFKSFIKNTLNARRSISEIHKKRYGASCY